MLSTPPHTYRLLVLIYSLQCKDGTNLKTSQKPLIKNVQIVATAESSTTCSTRYLPTWLGAPIPRGKDAVAQVGLVSIANLLLKMRTHLHD